MPPALGVCLQLGQAAAWDGERREPEGQARCRGKRRTGEEINGEKPLGVPALRCFGCLPFLPEKQSGFQLFLLSPGCCWRYL